ncbi:unnamed protein product [marine sediment metagenome]|uniref:Phosphoribosyltransferase domain-containing protein n=1 Tax=marine sediment metagenome TaxID=412755 RepID=X1H8D0_9ZZZZ
MMLENASKNNVIVSEIISKLRNKNTVPTDFRLNLRRLGNFLAFEAAKHLDYKTSSVQTPLGEAKYNKIVDNIVIISILRAALPMSDGVHETLPDASLGVISASRGKKLQDDGKDFRIDCTYTNIPYLEGSIAVIVDPMLASGSTLLFLLRQIENQKPKKIIILCAIASQYGIERIEKHNSDVIIIAGDVDSILNEKGYIIPGLGDAGDRAFNTS